jgi:hypothetical protein
MAKAGLGVLKGIYVRLRKLSALKMYSGALLLPRNSHNYPLIQFTQMLRNHPCHFQRQAHTHCS